MIRVQREAKQRLAVPVESADDPSSAVIQFAIFARGQRPSTFTAGEWLAPATQDQAGVWHRLAVTPRIGEGALDLAEGHYRFYGKLIIGSDEEIWEIDEEGLEVQ